MAFNNYFPATYQPYQYPQYQQAQAQQPVNNGIIWVQGEAGAKSYLVAPNTTVQLWDSESQTIFLKSADSSGMPSMKILDYTIRGDSLPSTPVSSSGNIDTPYATKAALEALQGEIDGLRAEMEKLATTRRRRKEDTVDE